MDAINAKEQDLEERFYHDKWEIVTEIQKEIVNLLQLHLLTYTLNSRFNHGDMLLFPGRKVSNKDKK